MTSFAQKVNHFNESLRFTKKLPGGIRVMNPFQENQEIRSIAKSFYDRFYDDTNQRQLILGINPGRLGAGATGIPFTDTKRLSEICGIDAVSITTHEPSSVFIYQLIDAFGGPEQFYGRFYINSVCPLGFLEQNERGNWINCNYYDYQELFLAVSDFIISSLKAQIRFGVDRSVGYVLGKRNAKYLELLNKEHHFFDSIVAFDHPRYIVQYKSKHTGKYIAEYLERLA